MRLGTLNNLRWLAVVGQTIALLVVRLLLDFDFPVFETSIVVAASATLNVVLATAYPSSKRLTVREATAFLAYDITQLAVLLFLTGGIENPFALLFLAPIVVSAATLNVASTVFLGGLAVSAITLLAFAHIPLPWRAGMPFNLPDLYQVGIWASLLLGIGFSSIYARRIASEATRMSAALSATQLALAREHRLAALGGLAAAAAHELGTPLGTIALVARELEHELSSSPHADDFRLLRAEAERCRAILTRLAQPEDAVLGRAETLPLGALLDDIAAAHRGVDVAILIDVHERTAAQSMAGTPDSTRSREPGGKCGRFRRQRGSAARTLGRHRACDRRDGRRPRVRGGDFRADRRTLRDLAAFDGEERPFGLW